MIKDKYPDLKIKVAGQNIVEGNWLNGSSYGLYVGKLIREYELENSVKFIGPQNAEQMKKESLVWELAFRLFLCFLEIWQSIFYMVKITLKQVLHWPFLYGLRPLRQ